MPQRQRERDEPLLGAVVQVALEPPALRQCRPPRSGRASAQLLHAGAQLRLQALVRASPGRRRRRREREQLGLVAQARGRARSRRRAGPRLHRRPRAARRRRAAAAWPSRRPSDAVVEPVEDLQRVVAERVGEQVAQAVAAARASPSRRSSSPTAPARRDAERSSPNRNTYGVDGEDDQAEQPESTSRRRLGPPTACVAERAREQRPAARCPTTAAAPSRAARRASRRASARART